MLINIMLIKNYGKFFKWDRCLAILCQYILVFCSYWYKGSFIYYARKIFRKTIISYPLIQTSTCVYQGVINVSFFRKFCARIKWMIPKVTWYFWILLNIPKKCCLNLWLSTERSRILKQICSWKLQVCLSMCDLLVETRH